MSLKVHYDRYYIDHPDGTNSFSLKQEGRRQKSIEKSKKYVY